MSEVYIFSGIFTDEEGSHVVKYIDKAVVTGVKSTNLMTLLTNIFDKYIRRMNLDKHQLLPLTYTYTDIMKNLPLNFKKFSIQDRYILIMECVRELFFAHATGFTKLIKQRNSKKPKHDKNEDSHKTLNSIDHNFNLRVRNMKKTYTVISETTNVNSAFTNASF